MLDGSSSSRRDPGLRAARPRPPVVGVLRVLGDSSTSSTSIPWRSTPARAGRGLATRLLRHVLAEAARRRARATLEVRRSNTAALRLYEGLGFDVAAIGTRYYT